jgi:hypothetical protein
VDFRVVPYAGFLEELPPLPPGMRFEMRNTLLPGLDDAAIAATVALLRGGAMLALRGLGGAAARVHQDATAFAHRFAQVMVTAAAMLPPGAPPALLSEALAAWPDLSVPGAGAYIGFLGPASADPGGVASAYPPATYRRLADVKRRYDPGNMFRRNHNIVPVGG